MDVEMDVEQIEERVCGLLGISRAHLVRPALPPLANARWPLTSPRRQATLRENDENAWDDMLSFWLLLLPRAVIKQVRQCPSPKGALPAFWL